jgi:hypothetical protein
MKFGSFVRVIVMCINTTIVASVDIHWHPKLNTNFLMPVTVLIRAPNRNNLQFLESISI